tara:strand:- start:9462 stop:10352 length:891 start_codon:yes stop_codon:yes gene_type:complete
MTVTSTELGDTGGLQFDAAGPTTTTQRRFVVKADSAEDKLETDLMAIQATGVGIGSFHPDYPTLVCVKIRGKRDADNTLVWRVTADYSSDSLIGPDIGPGPGFKQTWNLAVQAKFKDAFRRPPGATETAPANFSNPNEGAALDGDIGGIAVDSGGDPQSVLDTEPRLVIDVEIETNPTSAVSFLSDLLTYAGKRNSNTFLGAKVGQLLYLGANSRFLGNTQFGAKYAIQHVIAFDEYYHRVQVADRDLGRQGQYVIRLGASSDTDGGQLYVGKAFQVTYKQPFPELFDFRNLGIRL